MAKRTLSADEQALWAKVIESVEPLDRQPRPGSPPSRSTERSDLSAFAVPKLPERKSAPGPGTTLDASWDRKLTRGRAEPDFTIDLHSHSLSSAYDRLDRALGQAIASHARIVLLITGHAPKGEGPVTRGKIRAAVGDWLAASRHAPHIAAVRGAHPRHGGRGALYIVLRRRPSE
ncbi:Smr/MutS family protein [Parasphingopyxis algicola]|uniref:Smr/MutS family protein n=1 Tax=Parasphingopyxis algicola TaxID=2026624 RepID=UPI0015A4BD2E|nr:Smr/MutS family protein [Parasphingopyxis algicola]QLC24422.1 Smr/MutS family protein [Parasphingopyxis algicola]